MIVFHHIGLKAETSSLFYQLGHIGHLCTAVFFFLSGYGVMTRYMHDSNYQFGFLRNRLVSVLIPWLLVTVLYYLFDIVNGEAQTMGEIVNDLLKGRLIANNSWYVIVVSLCYTCFYFAIMISDGKRKRIIVVTIFGAIIWLGICCLCHLGSYYYETSHVFALGVLYAAIEKEALKKIDQRYPQLVIGTLLALLALVGFSFVFNNKLSNGIKEAYYIMSGALFTFFFILVIRGVKIGNGLLDALGRISFELYLIHGLFIRLLRSNVLYIDNFVIYSLLVVFSSICAAIFLHNIDGKIIGLLKKRIA